MSDTSNLRKITILGGGPAGSLLATLLGKKGYHVTVFEKRPDMRKHDISAGRSINLALANRGIKPLQAAGVMEKVNKILITMEGRMIHPVEGELQLQKYGQQAHEVIYSVSRGDLNSILMDAAEENPQVNINFEVDINNVDLDKKVISYNLDGTQQEHHFDILIGADGAGSMVRKAIDKFSGSFEEKQTQSIFHLQQLGHSYKELNIPAVSNNGVANFAMEANALHIWPRSEFMLIALPNEDKSFTVTLFLPNDGANSFASLENESQLDNFFADKFPDAKAMIPDLNKDFFENPTGHLATVFCDQWNYKNHTLLIGDAAHAIVPFHGQGMNCAFEDCLELVEQLEHNEQSWDLTIQQFQSIRKPNSDAIALMAIENYIEMRDSVSNKKYLLNKELSFKLEESFPDYFIPRYAMVMFHHMPYSEAFKRGKIQQQLLDSLTEDCHDISQVDMKAAAKMVLQRLDKIS
jgi:kynurenine 3-monooxygenase